MAFNVQRGWLDQAQSVGQQPPRFARAHPGVTVNLSTRLRPFDLASSGFDAAIHFGRADWPGAEHLLLMEEEVLPVCAPALLSQPVAGAEALLDLPLLMIESRRGDWGRWFAAKGLAGQRPVGMMFDQFATMQQAAIHGLGVALSLALFVLAMLLEVFCLACRMFSDRGPLAASAAEVALPLAERIGWRPGQGSLVSSVASTHSWWCRT